MKISEILNEASKPMRAWSGKLKKIDAILAWMYNKNILSKTDKARKDKVFYQYYRYYNDGDMPAALKVKGFSKFSNEKRVEEELEKYLETFIKEMLAKYLPRVNRSAFRLDDLIGNLNVVRDVARRNDAHGLLTYWLKKVKIKDEDKVLEGYVNELKTAYDTFSKMLDSKYSNLVVWAAKERMQKDGVWTEEHEKAFKAIEKNCKLIDAYVGNIVDGAQKLRKELDIKK